MSFGGTASKRRQAAQKHANRKRTCSLCGRVIYGNAFYIHRKACKRKHAGPASGNIDGIPTGAMPVLCMQRVDFDVAADVAIPSRWLAIPFGMWWHGALRPGDARAYRDWRES